MNSARLVKLTCGAYEIHMYMYRGIYRAIVCFVAYDRWSVNWHRVQPAHTFLNEATHDAPFAETMPYELTAKFTYEQSAV